MSNIIIKTPEQIEGIRKSSQLAGNALKFISPYIKEGVNTLFLNDLIEEYIRDNGAIPAPLNYHGYPKACCISPNNIICHGIPDKKTILKQGDILNIDVTTILEGYYGDTSTMFTIGEISNPAMNLIKATRHAMNLGIKQVRPGNHLGNIGFAIARYAQAKKYGVVYEFCGHGIGLEFHEEPQVDHIANKNTGPIMKPGMIFTIEPMINIGNPKAVIDQQDGWTARTIDNQLSAQFEHTVLVTKDGVDILSDVGEYEIHR